MKTKEELHNLKQNWLRHQSWDLETTDGFEAYHDELLEFRKMHEKQAESIKQNRIARGELWEELALNTDRLVVPGGWLYRTWSGAGLAMTFVPGDDK